MTAANLDHTNASAALKGGVINESVMQKIWLIDKFPLILTDLCSMGTHGNQFVEYTEDALGAPAVDNAEIDGSDQTGNDTVLGTRLGNYRQTAVKTIQVSTRANAANSIGRQASLSYQVMRGQQRLRRDVEAQMCTAQASLAGDGTAAAGISAGIGAWISGSANVIGGTGWIAGGFNTTTGIIDAPTPGTALPITEEGIRDITQAIFEAGGNTVCAMGTPTVIRLISEYLFTSGARIATMTNQDTSGTEAMTAYGSSNVMVLDFGVIKLIANRLMQTEDDDISNLYFLDPEHLQQSFLRGYRTEPLGKTGLSEKRLISCDYSLLALNVDALGGIFDIDETAAMLTVPV